MFEKLTNIVRRGEEDSDEDEQTTHQTPSESHAIGVSPSSIKLQSDSVRSGSKWCKTMFISDWPDTARPLMLDMVTTYPSDEVDVSIHASPRDQQQSIDEFDSAIRDLQSQQISESETGNPSASTKRRIQQHKEVLAQLEDGSQSVFDVSLYITVRTASEGRTEKVARKIANELQRHQLQATNVDYRQEDGLSSASPVAKDVLAHDVPDVSTEMLGRGVGALLPFSATTIIEEGGVLYGQHATTDSPVIIDRYARPNGHNIFTAGIIGAGKSYGTKLLNLREVAMDPDTILVMLDPLDGFRELADGLNAETITVDGTRGLNPLEIRPTPQHVLDADEENELSPFRQAFKGTMGFFEEFFRAVESGDETLSKTERSVLSEAVRAAYAQKGITSDPSTHDRESPTVMDVVRILAEIEDDARDYIETMEQDADLVDLGDVPKPSDAHVETWTQTASELRVSMHPFRTSEYAHLAGQSDISLRGEKVTYLDLQQGEGEREMGMMMQLLLDAVYQRAKQSTKKMILCVDEAHYLMQNEASLDWMERLTRHSRHHGLSLHLVTQEVSDFLVNDKAETIANNCSQKILHRLPGLTDEDADALGLTDREAEFVRKARPGTAERGYSHALVNVQDDATLPVKVWAYPKEERVIEGGSAETADSGNAAPVGGDD